MHGVDAFQCEACGRVWTILHEAASDSRHRPGSGETPMKPSDLVIVSTFRTPVDAQIAKGILDEARIESMIRADNAGGMYPAISGTELLVRAEDVQKATRLLQR